ncbi:hypothetical protein C8R45DRAFT_338980 [Mycena sanguinolenta]|nr:hypothetical protein C8R45DRAFT_338980 [Mycena sanguinolenta]
MTSMGLSKSAEAKAYDQVSSGRLRTPDITQNLLTGAATFVAAREFQKHCLANGKPPSLVEARALLAGFAGAYVDEVGKTQGLSNVIDKEKVKFDASLTTVLAYARDPAVETQRDSEDRAPAKLLRIVRRSSTMFLEKFVKIK